MNPILYRIMTKLLTIIVVLAIVYLFLRWFERANVWMPFSRLVASPSDIGLPYEDVLFHSEDGVELHGWFLPHPTARASLLFCHGNAGNVSHRLESLRQFHSLHLSVFIFDYRGYGLSRGRPSETGTYRDATAAYHWLRKRESQLPVVLFGRSLGAAIAADLAANVDAAAFIFESGFTSVPDIGAELFPLLPVRWLSAIRYDSLKKIPFIDMPLLVIHSPQDEIVSFRHGQAIYEAANDPKRFLELRGGHNDGFLFAEPDYLQGIDNFLDEYVIPTDQDLDRPDEPSPSSPPQTRSP